MFVGIKFRRTNEVQLYFNFKPYSNFKTTHLKNSKLTSLSNLQPQSTKLTFSLHAQLIEKLVPKTRTKPFPTQNVKMRSKKTFIQMSQHKFFESQMFSFVIR